MCHLKCILLHYLIHNMAVYYYILGNSGNKLIYLSVIIYVSLFSCFSLLSLVRFFVMLYHKSQIYYIRC